MRILHLGKYYSPYRGGIENFNKLLAEGASARSLSVAVLVHTSADQAAAECVMDGVKVQRARTFGHWLYTPIAPLFLLDLWRLVRGFQPQLIHVHLPNVSAFWLFFCPPAWGRPWLLHWHADVEFASDEWLARIAYRALYRPLEWLLLKCADAIVVTSPNYLASSAPLQAFRDKCHVVPLATTAGRDNAGDAGNMQWAESDLKVLMVGRETPYKGQEVLLGAVEQLHARGISIAVTIVGARATAADKRTPDCGHRSRVCFKGEASEADLAQLYESCDILCLPSLNRAEAFGLVLLEAMARGKPLLASALEDSGVGWVVEQDVNGWKFPAGDSAALADRLAWCATHRAELVAAGQRGKQRLEERFSPSVVIDRTVAIYRELCGQTD